MEEDYEKVKEVKEEIKSLYKEWNGENGKLLYSDAEVFEWQKINQKTHLSPKEAFHIMKYNEIINWEVKKIINKKNV